jgi:peptide chain release factor 3
VRLQIAGLTAIKLPQKANNINVKINPPLIVIGLNNRVKPNISCSIRFTKKNTHYVKNHIYYICRMSIKEEIEKRRTFGIISHPDAGKTTLTEKLLLFGGAIQTAGAVKSNKIKKTATSDWMEIEKQRGISVATSVMGFDYKNTKINILDTPGHKDFAEDTYRTLTAVDSVIVVIDVAKGVEPQTEKLVEVCKMRATPMLIFINKIDRPGKDAFDLLDEIEKKLNVKVQPLSWPIGTGDQLKGVYNIYDKNIVLFEGNKQKIAEDIVEIKDINSKELDAIISEDSANQLREDLELINGVYSEFDISKYESGEISPVMFGSALNTFGVKELLDTFIRIAPSPKPKETEERMIIPTEEKFSGFVFKIHANMDPKHRDRIAFIKICSGKFERNTNYYHVRLEKQIKFSNPTSFMAQKKEVIDDAYPGDIVGLYDSGNFKIGDALTSGEKLHFKGIPSFSPELFQYIENADPMKAKQLAKGIDQLMDEGVAQLFTRVQNGRKIIGTVGQLQFEVIQYRLEHEYNALCRYEPVQLHKACWIASENREQLADFKMRKAGYMARDKDGKDVFLADSAYSIDISKEKYPDIQFHFKSEF